MCESSNILEGFVLKLSPRIQVGRRDEEEVVVGGGPAKRDSEEKLRGEEREKERKGEGDT